MKLDLVDDPMYKFPLEKCPGRIVQQTMQKIVFNLQAVLAWMFESEINDFSKLPRPELFKNASFAVTPHSTLFLYSKDHGREIHDKFQKRIGFVWTVDPTVAVNKE
jgi:hypothetical protein